MISLLIYLIVLCLVGWLAFYVVDRMVTDPGLHRILRIVIVVILCLAVIMLLLDLAGHRPLAIL